MSRRERGQHAVAAAAGGVLGFLLVWLNRNQQPKPDARGLMAAVYVHPTPPWLYLVAAFFAALLAVFLSLAVAEVRARPVHNLS